MLALSAANDMGSWQADRQVVWFFEVVVLLTTLGLLVDLLRGNWSDDVLAGLVVDLGERSDTGLLRDELARALGDPSLVLGYWLPHDGRYVDDAGRTVSITEVAPARVVTPISDGTERLAVLVHDRQVLDDPRLLIGVAAAARVAIANARLQAEARERVADVAASRRRIVETADEQRRQLADELSAGVQRDLEQAAQRLDDLARRSPGRLPQLTGLQEELTRTRAEVDDLGHGIRPRALTEEGLGAALRGLGTSGGVPIDVRVSVGRLPDSIEAALYFVCCEALANATKHAAPSGVTIAVHDDDQDAVAIITDDGIGGADPALGTGLRGIRDRIEAVGGHLSVESEPGDGTRIRATVAATSLGPQGGIDAATDS